MPFSLGHSINFELPLNQPRVEQMLIELFSYVDFEFGEGWKWIQRGALGWLSSMLFQASCFINVGIFVVIVLDLLQISYNEMACLKESLANATY